MEKSKEHIESVLSLYCNLERNASITGYRDELNRILKKPSQTSDNIRYETLFSEVWEDFDKIPHYNNAGDYDYFSMLKENVIVPLGLDPDN